MRYAAEASDGKVGVGDAGGVRQKSYLLLNQSRR
jgi:hypothetical protein